MENLTQNHTVRERVLTPGSVCGSSVAWQVEDIAGGSLDPKLFPYHKGEYFPAFEPIHFTNLEALSTGRRTAGLEGGILTEYEIVGENDTPSVMLCRGTRSENGGVVVTSLG